MSTKGGAMNALPYLAGLATRHAWAEREYARLHAEIVEARLAARAQAGERAARRRARLRSALPVRRPEPVHCRRAAARPVRISGSLGGTR
ncbi:hypothetical protein [Actinomadura opuntiae]|uniref:hypothetical protein n=1 Tax=Actinomadura sp. OS1-43 TaxID=604315 RepID=UPI00255B3207|nr:hypothetical protein [Actinomadura sp. OS1-43]MDL4818144.1 hypothetical protein [Actinomadura sp. OS1-43]